MTAKVIPGVLIIFFAGLLLQTLACLQGAWAAVLCGAALSPIFSFLIKFFDIQLEFVWFTALFPAITSLGGVAIAFASTGNSFQLSMWLAPAAALATASIYTAARRSLSRKCSLCNRRIGGGVAFSCPRCSLLVCERKCWSFEYSRCVLCVQNRVAVLPPDGRWWDKRLGPRSSFGRCQSCQATAAEVDLRVCGKCGRPHCRECWDHLNGQCSRCDWVIDDLPESLQEFLIMPVQRGSHDA